MLLISFIVEFMVIEIKEKAEFTILIATLIEFMYENECKTHKHCENKTKKNEKMRKSNQTNCKKTTNLAIRKILLWSSFSAKNEQESNKIKGN